MSSLTTDIAILRGSKRTRGSTDIGGSRSLGNFENQTGGGRVRKQAIFGIRNARFGGGGAPADIEYPAFGADRSGSLGHSPDETHLEFGRGISRPPRHPRIERQTHHRV